MGGLTLPSTLAILGWAQALVLLIAFLLVSVFSLYLLDKACRAVPEDSEVGSIGGLITAIYGNAGAMGMELLMFLLSFGALVSYLGVIGVQLNFLGGRLLAPEPGSFLEAVFGVTPLMLVVAFGIILPCSLVPHEHSMKIISFVATTCMFFVMGVVTVAAPWRPAWPPLAPCAEAHSSPDLEPVAWVPSLAAVLHAAPMYIFSFNGATGFLPVRAQLVAAQFDPLRGVSSRKAVVLMWVAQGLVAINYAVMAFMGYLTFCADTPTNVMDGYPGVRGYVVLAKAALAAQLLCACVGVWAPLNRASAWSLIRGLHVEMPLPAKVLLTLFGLLAPVAISALLGGSLDLPLGLTSSICLTAFMFLLPGLVATSTSALGRRWWQRAIPASFAGFGLVVGITCTINILSK